jgi:hypothetical protein
MTWVFKKKLPGCLFRQLMKPPGRVEIGVPAQTVWLEDSEEGRMYWLQVQIVYAEKYVLSA